MQKAPVYRIDSIKVYASFKNMGRKKCDKNHAEGFRNKIRWLYNKYFLPVLFTGQLHQCLLVSFTYR